MKSHKSGSWTGKFKSMAVPLGLRLGRPLIWLRRRLKPHRVALCRVESSSGNNPPLSMLCGLSGPSKHFFLGRVFDGGYRESEAGKVKLMDVFRPDWSGRESGSCIVIEVSQLHYDWLKQPGWFFIPVWIAGEVSLPIPEEYLRRETVRSDLRKIQRQQYGYEVTQDEARFNDFYHQMHLPYVRKMHGEEACLDSYAEKRQQCSKYDLLLIHKKDQPGKDIAGMLIIHEPAGPRLWSLGVREDGVDHVHDGVIAALYHFSFEHLLAAGHKRLSLGNSRALLHDGVLNFKKKVSQTLRHASWQGLAFKISGLTPGVKNFLQKTPFIFFEKGGLYGAVFMEDELSVEKMERIDRSYFYPGLSRLIIYSFRVDERWLTEKLPASLAGRMEIRAAADLVQ